jgi:hypothetical protein
MEDSTSIDQLMGMGGGGMGGNGMGGGGNGMPNSAPEMLPSMDVRDNIPSMDQPSQMPFNPMQMAGGPSFGSGAAPMMPQNTSNVGMHHGQSGGMMPGGFSGNNAPQKRHVQPKKSFLESTFDKRSLTEMVYIVILFFIFNTEMFYKQVYKILPQLFQGGNLSKIGIILYGSILALLFVLLKKVSLP